MKSISGNNTVAGDNEEIVRMVEMLKSVMDGPAPTFEAARALSLYYISKSDHPTAYSYLKKAINLQPYSGEIWYLFGKTLASMAFCESALIALEKAGKFQFNDIRLHVETALCLLGLNRYEKALAEIDQSLSLNQNSLQALSVKGAICEMLGDRETATGCYRKVLELYPGEPSAIYSLSNMGTLLDGELGMCDTDHDVHRARKFSRNDLAFLHYAAAMELERQKKYDRAFFRFREANDTMKEMFPFDREKLKTRTDLHVAVFNEEFFKNNPARGNTADGPVFIVGMPRSGTTLVEQILSSHSRITAAGEITYISRIENSLVGAAASGNGSWPQVAGALGSSSLKEFADQYLHHIDQCITQKTKYFTDKMPLNFMNLGLIYLMFPNARIIHVRRNPLDTCVSCYCRKFNDTTSLSFSFDTDDTGYFYLEYERLMNHWKSVLPVKILEVEYEDLLTGQKKITEQMLRYTGVDWEDRCMEFHSNKRGVATASVHQVRKPIYKDAQGRWKNYRKHLGELQKLFPERCQ